MDRCSTLEEAINFAALLHGPFSNDQLATEDSRFHLFSQLQEIYWHIIDEFQGPQPQSELELYSTFFQLTGNRFWSSSPPDYHEINQYLNDYNTRTRTIPVYGALLLNYNMSRVLMVSSHLTKNGENTYLLTPPRGKRDQGENPQETAIREVMEETGLDITPFIVPDEFIQFTGKSGRQVQLYIVVTPLLGREVLPVPKRADTHRCTSEVDSLVWVALHEVNEVCRIALNTTSFRLLLEWCHAKICNPQSNKKGTNNIFLGPIYTQEKCYHFDEKRMNMNNPKRLFDLPSVYQQVKTYAAVCAGLLSVNFAQGINHTDQPFVGYSKGASGNKPTQVNNMSYFENPPQYQFFTPQPRNNRRRNNSNSRAASPPPSAGGNNSNNSNVKIKNANNHNNNNNKPALESTIAIDDLFNTPVAICLDDLFAAPIQSSSDITLSSNNNNSNNITTVSDNTMNNTTTQHLFTKDNDATSTTSSNSNSTSPILPLQLGDEERQSNYSQHQQQLSGSFVSPLAHLIPAQASIASKAKSSTTISTPTNSNTSASLYQSQLSLQQSQSQPALHPQASNTSPVSSVTLSTAVAPAAAPTTTIISSSTNPPVIIAPQMVMGGGSKLNNLKMKHKAPIMPLQPLAPK